MRKLLGILIAIIVIAAGIGYLAYVNSELILARIRSHKTQTPVSIYDITFKKESFTVSDLEIANPKGARLPTAVKVQTIDVKTPYKRYIESPIVIEEISMDSVYVNIQIYNKEQTEGNWHTIMKNMKEEHKSPLSNERIAIIKKLVLTNIKVDLILSDGSFHSLSPINRLEFDNIYSDKGIPTQEISEIIIQKMMNSIFLEKGLKAIIEAPVNVIKGVLPFL